MTTALPAPTSLDRPPRRGPALSWIAGASALAVLALPGQALAAAAREAGKGEDTALGFDDVGASPGPSDAGSSGGSIARVLIGLLVVVAVIYAVTWLLKQLRGSKDGARGTGIETITSSPLPGGGALHLVRVGDELLLVGAGTDGPRELGRYSQEQAREQGLWPDDPAEDDDGGTAPGGGNGVSILGRTISWSTVASGLGRWGTALVRRLREMTVRG